MQFKWLNESKIEKKGDRWEIYAPPHTDFFCNASGEEGEAAGTLCNAPVYYTEIEGDFVLKVKVSHDCASTYDAAALLVYKDETSAPTPSSASSRAGSLTTPTAAISRTRACGCRSAASATRLLFTFRRTARIFI